MPKKVIIISGGFDPIHIGHIELIQKSAKSGDKLIAILNTDDFLKNKKGKPFMPFDERKIILENIKGIDEVVKCIDQDQTVRETLKMLALRKTHDEELIFANGGDRKTLENVPEAQTCAEHDITMIDGLGEKIQSSSWLIGESQK